MFGFLTKILDVIPFFVERSQNKRVAVVALQQLRSSFVFYRFISLSQLQEYDRVAFQWAVDHLDSIPEEDLAPGSKQLSSLLQTVIDAPQDQARDQFLLYAESRHGITKIFPPLEVPNVEEKSLSRRDIALFNRLKTKVRAINTGSERLMDLNRQTFDNSMTTEQREFVHIDIRASYETIATQAHLGADMILEMDLLEKTL
jgi:hypothetical protein